MKLLFSILFFLFSCNFGQLDNSSDPFKTQWTLEVVLINETGNVLPCKDRYTLMQLIEDKRVVMDEIRYKCEGQILVARPITPAGIYHIAGQYRGLGGFEARNIKIIPEYDQTYYLKLIVKGDDL